MSEKMMRPFSNGTESMIWYDNNCCTCKKAWHSKDGNYPKEETLKAYVRQGKYCKLQYDLDLGFVISEIPESTADQIGTTHKSETYCTLKETCMMWSEKDEDDNRPRPRKPRDPSGPNQLCLPIELIEIERNIVKQIQLTKTEKVK